MDISKFEKIRIEKNMYKVDISRLAKMSEVHYDNIISGKVNPGIAIIEKICRALEINPGKLWEDDNSFVKEPDPVGYKKRCLECETKDAQIKELYKTIENLNDCIDVLRSKKKSGPDETPKLAKKH